MNYTTNFHNGQQNEQKKLKIIYNLFAQTREIYFVFIRHSHCVFVICFGSLNRNNRECVRRRVGFAHSLDDVFSTRQRCSRSYVLSSLFFLGLLQYVPLLVHGCNARYACTAHSLVTSLFVYSIHR